VEPRRPLSDDGVVATGPPGADRPREEGSVPARRGARFGLATKFNVLVVGVVLATTLGTGALTLQKQVSESYAQLLSDGAAISATVAENSEYAFYTANHEALQQIAAGLEAYPSVAYVRFLNARYEVLLESSFTEGLALPEFSRHQDPIEGASATYGEFRNPEDGRSYVDLVQPALSSLGSSEEMLFGETGEAAPKQQELLGYVQVGLSQEGLRRRMQAYMTYAAWSMALCVLLGIGLTLILTRTITSPIRSLVHATREVAEGRFEHSIEVHTRDELHDLATSFDAMLHRLRDYRAEVESYQ